MIKINLYGRLANGPFFTRGKAADGPRGSSIRPSLRPFIRKAKFSADQKRLTSLLDTIRDALTPADDLLSEATLQYEKEMARPLLQEASDLYHNNIDQVLFPLGLRLAEYCHRLGDQAKLDRTVERLENELIFPDDEQGEARQRLKMVKLLLTIGRTEAAIATADELEQPGLRFQAFYEYIVPALAAAGGPKPAIECLAEHCLDSFSPRDSLPVKASKIDRLLLVAKKLTELGAGQMGKNVVLQTGQLAARVFREDRPLLEKTAILLLKSGLRQEAVELLLNASEYLSIKNDLSTTEQRERLLHYYWPKFYEELVKVKNNLPKE